MSTARTSKPPSTASNPWKRVATLVITGLLLTSCWTQETRTYSIPKTLCGTEVPGALIDPFLAPGKTVSQELDDFGDRSGNYSFCRIRVDGKRVLSVINEWYPRDYNMARVASAPLGVRLSDHLSGDGSYTYAERGGVIRVQCHHPDTTWKRENGKLFVTVYSADPAPPSESAMKNLVTGYAKAVSASGECN
ncbi:hypothetical protein [Streptomyces sp. NPDC051561]|uniref:hypothetical protein n=1 Tax=Streptomyces sp. NPDC051561 TaxID=3365658 RepID=UPI003796058A